MRSTWLAILMCFAAASAAAHRSDDDIIRVSYAKGEVRLDVMVAAAVLDGFDANRDGRLSKAEFVSQRATIASWVDQHILCVDTNQRPASILFSDITVPHLEELGPHTAIARVRILRSFAAGKGDAAPLVRFDLWAQNETARPYSAWAAGQLETGHLTNASNVLSLKK